MIPSQYHSRFLARHTRRASRITSVGVAHNVLVDVGKWVGCSVLDALTCLHGRSYQRRPRGGFSFTQGSVSFISLVSSTKTCNLLAREFVVFYDAEMMCEIKPKRCNVYNITSNNCDITHRIKTLFLLHSPPFCSFHA